MHTQRVISGAVLVPIVISLLALGGWPFRGLVVLVTLLAAVEFTRMFRSKGIKLSVAWICLITLAWEVEALRSDRWGYLPVVTLVVLGLTLRELWVARQNPSQPEPTERWALSLAMGTYLGIGGGHLMGLRALPDGLWWVLTTLLIVWIGDSAAYYLGSRLGRHKMAPSISPGKSWEGYAAQVISGTLVGAFLAWLWPVVFSGAVGADTTLTLWRGLILGTIVSVLSPAGDFLISMMKREVGVKDTGHLIPGHGGVLDRIDSVVWAAMLAHVFAQAFF